MGEFVALAARGGFAVNEHGGRALLKAIHEMLAWIDDQRYYLDALRQEPLLGSSTNAQAVKPFMREVAEDESGFLTQLLKLRESLGAAESAIQQAMANYQGADAQAADRLGER
ncbi:hypothetical protein Aglo03_16740 [Actinokineospora globicatena]|uniref:Uncharacterized protein n=2 Tax=Actinokineospora globicatena TaxID=103729 RepID=A0A9W6V9D2_9PSEU|nr:hypothetical protein Aglo03_16740 [Actinokineospora globicatena]